MNYDPNRDYYEILGVESTASTAEIEEAHNRLSGNTDGMTEEQINNIHDAYFVLMNNRQEYDDFRTAHLNHDDEIFNSINQHLDNGNLDDEGDALEGEVLDGENNHRRGARVIATEDDERTAKRGRGLLAVITCAVIAAAIIAGSVVAGMHIQKNKDQNSNNNTEETNTTSELSSIGVQAGSEIEMIEPGVVETTSVQNFGDISSEELTTNAQTLLDYVNSIGAINMSTGANYTLEEMKALVQYMNGAYVPTNEAQAFNMEDQFLNFACVPLNDTQFINGVMLMSGVSKEDIGGSVVCKEVSFVDTLLMGDSVCYPYLYWLEDQYNTIITSEDIDLRVSTYNKVMQSYADIMFGNGFSMTDSNGKQVTITSNDITSKNRINDGNIFRLFGLIFQPLRSAKTQEQFTIDGNITVNADQILEQMNVMCASDIAEKAEYNSDGYIVLPNNDNLDNTYNRIQTNTLGYALTNYYLGNDDYYQNTQSKSK